jgi:hypothetical protein
LCFSLLFRKNPDDGQSPKTQYLCISIVTWGRLPSNAYIIVACLRRCCLATTSA